MLSHHPFSKALRVQVIRRSTLPRELQHPVPRAPSQQHSLWTQRRYQQKYDQPADGQIPARSRESQKRNWCGGEYLIAPSAWFKSIEDGEEVVVLGMCKTSTAPLVATLREGRFKTFTKRHFSLNMILKTQITKV